MEQSGSASAGSAEVPASPVAALTAALDALLAEQWWQHSEQELRAAVVAMERQASRLDAARLRALREADTRHVARTTGAVGTAAWLAGEGGHRPAHAHERVRVAEAVNGPLAATGAALAAGELTVEHAGVIAKAMDALPWLLDASTRAEAEAFLVEQAAHMDPGQLARAARHLTARLDPHGDEHLERTEGRQEVQRGVTLHQRDDGAWRLRGLLEATAGATLAAALDPLAAPRPSREDGRDTRTAPQRRADAVTALAEAWLAGHHGGGEHDEHQGTARPRPRLVVTVPSSTLIDPGAPGAAPAELDTGAPLSQLTLSVLACDAEVQPVLLDPAGVPLDVGRTVYSFPDKLRVAIRVRDRHCTFPGCTRPASWCDTHHLTAYSQGGATSERNGSLLCGFHHRLVHRWGWRGELTGARVVWHPPERDETGLLAQPPPWRPALERLVDRWHSRTPRRAA